MDFLEALAAARRRAATPALYDALRALVRRIEANGEWDDGCFYYQGRSASELQGPLRDAHAALKLAEGEQ